MLHRAIALVMLCSIACGSDDPVDGIPTVYGGDRPVSLQIPLFTEGQVYPLVLILHGYGASGFVQEAYFGLDDLVERGSAFVLAPDGLVDSMSRQFWNADDTCCDFDNQDPDDVAYLGGLVDEVMADWPIDPQRVRIIGHSNGGFMAYRLACDRADLFTSIVSLAGNAASVTCNPVEPVHVLHIHGTADATVPFTGAAPSIDEWAARNSCSATGTPAGTFDLDAAILGAETSAATRDGCAAGGTVEQWTMTDSGHIPNLTREFDTAISQWWADHPRPD